MASKKFFDVWKALIPKKKNLEGCLQGALL